MCSILAVFVFFLIPFAYFYGEEDGEKSVLVPPSKTT